MKNLKRSKTNRIKLFFAKKRQEIKFWEIAPTSELENLFLTLLKKRTSAKRKSKGA